MHWLIWLFTSPNNVTRFARFGSLQPEEKNNLGKQCKRNPIPQGNCGFCNTEHYATSAPEAATNEHEDSLTRCLVIVRHHGSFHFNIVKYIEGKCPLPYIKTLLIENYMRRVLISCECTPFK